jgi:hypothetical protein
MTWLVWRAIGKHPQTSIVASAIVLNTLPMGFARMGHRWMRNIFDPARCGNRSKIRVWGSQGSPQAPVVQRGPARAVIQLLYPEVTSLSGFCSMKSHRAQSWKGHLTWRTAL